MSDETRPILCSACGVPAEAVIIPGANTKIRCPQCGAEDDMNEAVAAAAKYQIGQMLGSALSGGTSGGISFQGGSQSQPRFFFG